MWAMTITIFLLKIQLSQKNMVLNFMSPTIGLNMSISVLIRQKNTVFN